MTQVTILDYLPRIQNVVAKIPTDRFITATEIGQLDVEALKIAFYYTFPVEFGTANYLGLKYLFDLAGSVIMEIPDNSVVIASGDSPSKVVALINLLWKTDTDTYTYHYDMKSGSKRIKFVTFPISGLRGTEARREQVLVYLKGVLDSNQVDYTGNATFYDLDFILSGKTHKYLESTLHSLNPKINFIPINLDLRMKALNLRPQNMYDKIWGTITEAEVCEARCVPRYSNLNEAIPSINMRRCNMIVIMTYLKALDRLGRMIELPYKKSACAPLENGLNCIGSDPGYYYLDYYDFGDNERKVVLAYIKSPNNDHVDVIEPDVYDFRSLMVLDKYIIKVTRIPNEEIYGPEKFDHKRITSGTKGVATLINGFRVKATHNGVNYRIGTSDVRFAFVKDFKPTQYIQTVYSIVEALLLENQIQDSRVRSSDLVDTLMEFDHHDGTIYLARVQYNAMNQISPPFRPDSYFELLEKLIQTGQLKQYQLREDLKLASNNHALEFKDSQGYMYVIPIYVGDGGEIYRPH